MSLRRRIESSLVAAAIVALLSIALPGTALTASPGPDAVGSESPAQSGATESPAASGSVTGGFATPEDAARAYLAAVAANDFADVLSTCAVLQMAKGYRFDLAAVRLNALVLSTMWAPATNPFYVEINSAIGQGQLARAVMFLSYSLLLDEPIDPATVIAPVDEAMAHQFIDQVDPAQLAGLLVEDVRFPKASLEDDPRLLANQDKFAKIYGADEQTERVALVSLNGKEYAVGFQLIRYDADWFVAYPNSTLYGLSATGIAEPTTRAEFEDKTSS